MAECTHMPGVEGLQALDTRNVGAEGSLRCMPLVYLYKYVLLSSLTAILV